MVKRIVKWAIKRYAVRALNDLMSSRIDKVEKASATVALWAYRTSCISNLVANLNVKIKDGNLSELEAESAIREIESVIKAW